jgi:hypothetical protein
VLRRERPHATILTSFRKLVGCVSP